MAIKKPTKTQTYDYFNIFIAPFARGIEAARIKENVRLFILSLNHHAEVTLELELTVPKSMTEKEAVGPNGKITGKYADFVQESQQLASAIVEVFAEESAKKPLLNPKLVIKIDNDTYKNETAKAILLKTHALAAEKGTIYFANTARADTENANFSASGVKLSADLTADWETDTLRAGCLGFVTINMPRITQESEKDKNKFFDLVRERFELAARALGIKNSALKQFGKNSLPFLLKSGSGDVYFQA